MTHHRTISVSTIALTIAGFGLASFGHVSGAAAQSVLPHPGSTPSLNQPGTTLADLASAFCTNVRTCVTIDLGGSGARTNLSAAETLAYFNAGGIVRCSTIDSCPTVTRGGNFVVPPGATLQTSSTSAELRNTVRRVTLATVTIGSQENGPLQRRLAAIIPSPSGTALQSGLAGVLDAPTSVFIGRQLNGFNSAIRLEDTIGPATINIGSDRTVSFSFQAGVTNVNLNQSIEFLFTDTYQTSQNITPQGASWLGGDLHANVMTAILDESFGFTDGLLRLPRDARSLNKNWNLWLHGGDAQSSFDSNASQFGFRTQGSTISAGIERMAGPLRMGVALGTSDNRLAQVGTGDHGDLDTQHIGVYATHQSGAWQVSGVIDAGTHKVQTQRLSNMPTPARTEYRTESFSAGVEVTRRLKWGNSVNFEPLFGVVNTTLRSDDFAETGGSGLGIASRSAETNMAKAYVGIRINNQFSTRSGMKIEPEFRARYLFDFSNDPRTLSARFVDDPLAVPFNVVGILPVRDGALVGGGLNVSITNQLRAHLNYDAEIRGGDTAHVMRLGASTSF